MHGKFGLLSPGKANSHSTVLPIFFSFFLPCVECFCVSVPPAVGPTLLQHMDMGSSTCTQIWVCAMHMKGGQAQTCLHKSCLGGTEKLFFTMPRQGIEPRVFGFEFWLSNHWPASPVKSVVITSPCQHYFIKSNLHDVARSNPLKSVCSRLNGGGHCFYTCIQVNVGKQIAHAKSYPVLGEPSSVNWNNFTFCMQPLFSHFGYTDKLSQRRAESSDSFENGTCW